MNFLAESLPEESPYSRVVQSEAKVFQREDDHYLIHEFMEDVNQPMYFYEFMEEARAKGLQYLGEAWFHTRLDNLPERIRETVENISASLVHQEQYLDFLRTHVPSHLAVPRRRRAVPAPRSETCHDHGRQRAGVAASKRRLTWRHQRSPSSKRRAAKWSRRTTPQSSRCSSPCTKPAREQFPPWNCWIRCDSNSRICRRIRLRYPRRSLLPACWFKRTSAARPSCTSVPAKFTMQLSERPLASPLARFQARHGRPVVNLRHQECELTNLKRAILMHLDGQRDRAALLEVLRALMRDAVLVPTTEETTQTTPPSLDDLLSVSLTRISQAALLLS